MKCGRLYKNFCRWFSEKRKKGLPYSYRFTGLESKRFCWNFGLLIKVLLGIANISSSIKVKLHALAFSALQPRDSGSLFSRVEISREQLVELESVNCISILTPFCLMASTPQHGQLDMQSLTAPNNFLRRVGLDLD